MPRLLTAEDVARAADLEVGQGDLEARPELRGVEDRLEPLACLVRQPLAPSIEQVRVRPPRRPTDPPAKLVELRQPERVRAIDDDRVRVRDVEARFDDGRADQDIGGTSAKAIITFSSAPSAICPCPTTKRASGSEPAQLLGLGLDRLDPVVDVEDLAAAIELAQDRVAHETGSTLRATRVWIGSRSSGGVSITLEVADAGHRQVQRARDRRRRQGQDIDFARGAA